MPEGKEEEQEFENSQKIMKENVPNLAKELEIQVQEAQIIPNQVDPMRTTPRRIIIKMTKVKDKERILKAAREMQLVTYWGFSASSTLLLFACKLFFILIMCLSFLTASFLCC